MNAFFSKIAQNKVAQIIFLLVLLFSVGKWLLLDSDEPKANANQSPKSFVEQEGMKEEIERSLQEKQIELFQKIDQRIDSIRDEFDNKLQKEGNILGYWNKKLRSTDETQTGEKILKLGQELKESLEKIEKAIPNNEERLSPTKKDLPAEAGIDAESLNQVLSQRLAGDPPSKVSAVRWLREKAKENPGLVSPQVARLLADRLFDEAEPVKSEAEFLLLEVSRKNGEATKRELVSYMLEQGDKKRAERIALLLVRIGPYTIPELTKALDTDDKEKLKRLSWCLKRIGPPAIESLQEVYESGSVSASMAAYELLQAIPPPKIQ